MSELDDAIRSVMSGEEGEPADESLQQMIVQSFRGRWRRFTVFAFVKMTGAALLMSLGAALFFTAQGTRAQLACATAVIVGVMGMGIWWTVYWIQINRNAEAREIKRLELQIAQLARKLES